VQTLIPFERVVISIIINKKSASTERSDELERLRDLAEGKLSEVAHDWRLRELQVLLLGGHTTRSQDARRSTRSPGRWMLLFSKRPLLCFNWRNFSIQHTQSTKGVRGMIKGAYLGGFDTSGEAFRDL